jgi:hypothetical protein
MISAYLNHLLADIEGGAKVDYLEGEKCVTRELRVEVNGEELIIPVKGYIDRLERYNGVLRIIDFKTGSVEPIDLKVKVDGGDDPAEAISDQLKKLPKALQLMLYEWLLQDEFATEKRDSLIISLLAPKNDKLRLKVELEADNYLAHFEAFLKETIKEMLDPKVPIIYSEDFEYGVFE